VVLFNTNASLFLTACFMTLGLIFRPEFRSPLLPPSLKGFFGQTLRRYHGKDPEKSKALTASIA
jgi:hypothetical protein